VAEANATNPKQCAGHRKDGSPCTGLALGGSAYCFAHDPALAEQRAEARRKGGLNRSSVVRARGLVPPRLLHVFDKLEQALDEVHSGRLDARNASAMASIAGAMVKVLTAGELEERVRSLEAKGVA
jgi:hypothetical protein